MTFRLLVNYAFIIFGWGNAKQKDLGETYPAACGRCGNEVFYHFVKFWKRFSLFFIPLIPYGRKYFLSCPICSNSIELDKETKKVAKEINSSIHEKGEIDESVEEKMDELEDLLGKDEADNLDLEE